jgi:peptidoglycan/xylan/chitin deacetylase (PgdA/CDA1 family)
MMPTSRAIILSYHRVATPRADPWGLCVSPENFAAHLEVLRAAWHPVPLARLGEALNNRRLDDRSVVVTFDDGYADNLSTASPLLEHYAVPATVFVVAGSHSTTRSFWWDELERILLHAGRLPQMLRVQVGGRRYEWNLGAAADFGWSDVEASRGWRAWQDPPTVRHAAYRALWEALQPCRQAERLEVLAALADAAELAEPPEAFPAVLSAAELVRLSERPGIEIGAHTVTHPPLAALSPPEQRAEIAGSRSRLAAHLALGIPSFAYPFGAACNYTGETVALVRTSGFSLACTTQANTVTVDSDPFQLPRFPVEDCAADEFSRRLSRWFEG